MEGSLKVLHLSSHDYGGAGNAAVRLHKGLCASGVDSRMLVYNHRSSEEGIIDARRGFISRLFLLASKAYLKFSADAEYGYQYQCLSLMSHPMLLLQKVGFKPDIIITHNLSHFVSPSDLLALHRQTSAPVIFNLLDLSLLTGGCHYAWDCRGYERNCGRCPCLRFSSENDYSRTVWTRKSEAFKLLRGTVVAPTSLLLEQVSRSSIFRNWPCEKVMLGVEPDVFTPSSRREARLKLGLPPDSKVIFFGAQLLSQKRKGMVYLIDALNILSEQGFFAANNAIAVCAGNGDGISELLDKNVPIQSLGFLHGDASLALAYNAADVFACPSIEDSGPMMINESIMCGTPVVAFRMGVADDLIINDETGYIAALRDSKDLAYGIERILSQDSSGAKAMSDRCRAKALGLCHPASQISSFIAICERNIL